MAGLANTVSAKQAPLKFRNGPGANNCPGTALSYLPDLPAPDMLS